MKRPGVGSAASLGLAWAAAAALLLRAWAEPGEAAVVEPAAAIDVRVASADASGAVLDLRSGALPSARDLAAMAPPGATIPGGAVPAGAAEVVWDAPPGRPVLPSASLLLGVPPEAEIRLVILEDEAIPLAGHVDLPAATVAVPAPGIDLADRRDGDSIGRTDTGPADLVPDAIDHRDVPYPVEAAVIGAEAWVRGRRMVRVTLFPFQYNPVRGTVVQHRRLRVAVRFEGRASESNAGRSRLPLPPPGAGVARSAGGGGAPASPDPFDAFIEQALANGAQARSWTAAPDEVARHIDAAALSAGRASIAQAASGPRVKLSVDREGMFRVSPADLAAAGIVVGALDPRTFELTSQGRAVAIHVVGEADGRFDPSDAVIFYGQPFRGKPATIDWLGRPLPGTVTDGKYTDTNVYWLRAGGAPGPRMIARDGAPGAGTPTAGHFMATARAERSQLWYTRHFTSDDTWFWRRINGGDEAAGLPPAGFGITLTGAAALDLPATVRGEMVGIAYSDAVAPDHNVRITLNAPGRVVQDVTWDGPTRLRFGGQVPASALIDGTNALTVSARLQPGVASDAILFDWFEVTYPRRFEAEGDALAFGTLSAGRMRYGPGGFTSADIDAFDVTQPSAPVRITGGRAVADGGRHGLAFDAGGDARFVAVARAGYLAPRAIARVDVAALADPGRGADYIVIAPRALRAAVERLAVHRAARGMRVAVVDVEDVYDAFNFGIYGPRAIRNFLAWAYAEWRAPAPAYVVLVGDGHWNFRGAPAYADPNPILMPPNLEWVDPEQGEVDSANRLAALVGDDAMPDLAIARLPVNTVGELEAAIDKIVRYETAGPQPWGRRHVFIADNSIVSPGVVDTAGDFARSSDTFIRDHLPRDAVADRIYLDRFIESGDCRNYTTCPQASRAVTTQLGITGALLVNYVGHGSVNWWAHEHMLDTTAAPTLRNGDRWPVVLSWTCLDGYWSYPGRTGLAEMLVRMPNAGAVSTYSPTGLGLMTGHEVLQEGLYDAIFAGGEAVLGPATVAGKLRLFRTGRTPDLIDTYTIFGDPALRLQVPPRPGIDPTASPPAGATPSGAYLPMLFRNGP